MRPNAGPVQPNYGVVVKEKPCAAKCWPCAGALQSTARAQASSQIRTRARKLSKKNREGDLQSTARALSILCTAFSYMCQTVSIAAFTSSQVHGMWFKTCEFYGRIVSKIAQLKNCSCCTTLLLFVLWTKPHAFNVYLLVSPLQRIAVERAWT